MRHFKLKHTYIFLSLLIASCSFEADEVFTDERMEEYELYDYYVDQYGNEGIIAYISSNKECVIALSLDESLQYWGPTGEEIYKGSTKRIEIASVKFGVAMHQAMMSMGIERFPAQNWCNQKNISEQYPRAGSWRLPSRYDFSLIFGTEGQRLERVNAALKSANGTPLEKEEMYWTCTEDIDGYITFNDVIPDYDQANRAVTCSPLNTTNYNKDRWIKKNQYLVRAIKYVYYEY